MRRRGHAAGWLVAGLVAALLLAACGGEPPAAEVGRPLPPFALEDLDGNTVRSSDLLGQPTVLAVWATWCQPCIREMPLLERLDADPRLRVVSIALDDGGRTTVAPFAQKRGITYPILLGDQKTFQSLAGWAIPHTLLVNADGTVAEIMRGTLDEGRVEGWVGLGDGSAPSSNSR